ncbi:hypothetical protein J3R30DRAFT_159790 [Lentinula aciculospora]|uniref:Uncharacterized protein n=1 Tax=Lentinula aciculospora TaxID=153920 RepID=A0A9W9AX76_9AGAR|nr:hypothetical protein J3R30DRAFT_159790 [Lentinula aciculospora]
MHLTLFILISWLSVTQMVTWKRGKSDPNSQFFLQKIKLDNSKGPTPKSTPVAITNSQNYEGTSPMAFNRAGLFQIIAVDIQNEKTFFSTEITVLPNPTSYLFPTATSGSKTGKSMMNMMGNPSKVTSLQNSASSSSGSAITIFGPLVGQRTTLLLLSSAEL